MAARVYPVFHTDVSHDHSGILLTRPTHLEKKPVELHSLHSNTVQPKQNEKKSGRGRALSWLMVAELIVGSCLLGT